jgi:hypothetical protein
MLDIFKQTTLGQFEAALAMLRQCIDRCPEQLWEGKIAELTVRQVAYHTLFFVDFYLTADEAAFELRDLHRIGGDEREPINSPGLSRVETLAYFPICLEKLRTTLAAETEETLRGPSGFSWLPFSRAEIHLYNLRHVQHHAGQLSAHLRRLDPACKERSELRWVRSGWVAK